MTNLNDVLRENYQTFGRACNLQLAQDQQTI